MQNKIKHYLNQIIFWIKKHIWQLAIVIAIHIIATRIVDLPYINLVTSLVSFLPIIIDWIVILLLFKPNKQYLLYIGIALFPLAALLALIHFNHAVEILGNFSYLFIFTYIILSLKEIRK